MNGGTVDVMGKRTKVLSVYHITQHTRIGVEMSHSRAKHMFFILMREARARAVAIIGVCSIAHCDTDDARNMQMLFG